MKYHDRRNIISFNQYEHYLISVKFVIVLCYSESLETLQLVISLFNDLTKTLSFIHFSIKTKKWKITKLSTFLLYVIYDRPSHPFSDNKI